MDSLNQKIQAMMLGRQTCTTLLIANYLTKGSAMANPKNVHVVQRGDQWGTLREGAKRATSLHDTQAQAINAGREMARTGEGELLIHGRDNLIRARDSYGNDPCPPKDEK